MEQLGHNFVNFSRNGDCNLKRPDTHLGTLGTNAFYGKLQVSSHHGHRIIRFGNERRIFG